MMETVRAHPRSQAAFVVRRAPISAELWIWRFEDSNGLVIAASPRTWDTQVEAFKAAEEAKAMFAAAEIERLP